MKTVMPGLRRLLQLGLVAVCLLVWSGCGSSNSGRPFEIEDITMEDLAAKMDQGETFTLLVERDACNFCQAINSYLEQTSQEHPGVHLYRINTTNFQLHRAGEEDMTLVSSTPEGQAFLERFPYFLYTPAAYKILEGKPVEAGIGYDESRHTVSVWNTDSTIDWKAAAPVDLWEFLSKTPGS